MSEVKFGPGPRVGTVRCSDGRIQAVPQHWSLLPPGDAALTRRVKAAGEHWLVQEKKGRRVFSLGVWAPAETIDRLQAELIKERSTDEYAKKQRAAAARRSNEQSKYVGDFTDAVNSYLSFHPKHAQLATRLSKAIAQHATPVGSGTVARTKRIPIEQRAESAVIAWLRHQTTGYDSMKIPRVKGKRREVRRQLAKRSKELLSEYRSGTAGQGVCNLKTALASWERNGGSQP